MYTYVYIYTYVVYLERLICMYQFLSSVDVYVHVHILKCSMSILKHCQTYRRVASWHPETDHTHSPDNPSVLILHHVCVDFSVQVCTFYLSEDVPWSHDPFPEWCHVDFLRAEFSETVSCNQEVTRCLSANLQNALGFHQWLSSHGLHWSSHVCSLGVTLPWSFTPLTLLKPTDQLLWAWAWNQEWSLDSNPSTPIWDTSVPDGILTIAPKLYPVWVY